MKGNSTVVRLGAAGLQTASLPCSISQGGRTRMSARVGSRRLANRAGMTGLSHITPFGMLQRVPLFDPCRKAASLKSPGSSVPTRYRPYAPSPAYRRRTGSRNGLISTHCQPTEGSDDRPSVGRLASAGLPSIPYAENGWHGRGHRVLVFAFFFFFGASFRFRDSISRIRSVDGGEIIMP